MSRRLARRRLVEPDYWTCPHGVRVRPEKSLTFGPEVADICDEAGFTPDPQQELGLDLIFAIRQDGSPESFSFCVICARQNLKSGLFLQAVIGWLFVLDDVPEIAWSAHELRTALDAQRTLFEILQSPALSKFLIPGRLEDQYGGLYTANGQERIELNTGQKVWFQTRTRDGGRGLGKPKVILDEALKLKARMVGALLPILLAQHQPQLLYGSSAPPFEEDSAQLRDVMDRGRHHKSPEMSYIEWLAPREPCADPDCQHPKDAVARKIDCALDREHLIRRANPTLTTGRITMQTIRNLRQELPPVEFMRECLGWAEEKGDADPPALDLKRWGSLKNDQVAPPTRGVVVVDVEPDQSAGTIGLAGNGPRGRTLLLVQHRKGTAWIAKSVKKLAEECELLEVRIHPASPAGALIKALKRRSIEVTKMSGTDMGIACASFQTGVNEAGRYVHVGQPEFDAAIAAARTKRSGQAEQWDRTATTVPMGPVVATSSAAQRWEELAAEKPPPPPPPPRKAQGRLARSPQLPNLNTIGF